MPSLYASTATLLAALLTSAATQAQEPAVASPDFATLASARRTLLKVGTGLTRGFDWSGSTGLALPVVLGIEHTLATNWSVYGNAFTGIQVVRPENYSSYITSAFRRLGLDAGVRYYYHQAKRVAKGRAAGPFIGNYVALHVPTTTIWVLQSSTDAVRLGYKQTAIMGVWGMQRCLGAHGLLDAFAGAGISNPRVRTAKMPYITLQSPRKLEFDAEIGVRLSLIR
jgi:hypothetical protein